MSALEVVPAFTRDSEPRVPGRSVTRLWSCPRAHAAHRTVKCLLPGPAPHDGHREEGVRGGGEGQH